MNKSNVEQIVQEVATENFNLYPEDYPIENGVISSEVAEFVQDLAINYYENRTELDAKRDEVAEVTKIDYVDFVMAAFSTWVQEKVSEQHED